MRLQRFAAAAKAAFFFVSVITACVLWSSPAVRAGEALQRLEFVTESGPHAFRVELADTPEERAKGLMFRRSMPQDQGMLFDFGDNISIMMWMKNTYIPLDMVFITREGVVSKIVADTTPMSENVIAGGVVSAVVELNAGVAKQIGLKPGDEVRHAVFKR
jgi:uncharacterized membrane protein (UPF0127 family)